MRTVSLITDRHDGISAEDGPGCPLVEDCPLLTKRMVCQ
jgi:hypothetical protein